MTLPPSGLTAGVRGVSKLSTVSGASPQFKGHKQEVAMRDLLQRKKEEEQFERKVKEIADEVMNGMK